MKAYVTLLINESYVPGALVLGQALKKTGTKHRLVILMDNSTISTNSQRVVESVYDDIIKIDEDDKLFMPVDKVAKKLGRPQLAVTLTKIIIWQLVQYEQIIYLDADTVPLKSLDHLFEKYDSQKSTEVVSAPDIGWPDIFNSGVMVIKPDLKVFEHLKKLSESENSSYDGADQGLLNEAFHLQGDDRFDWIRLPFVYNMTPSSLYQNNPAIERFFHDIHVVHFVGSIKPWLYSPRLGSLFHDLWWKIFNEAHLESERIKLLSHNSEDVVLKSDGGETFANADSISKAFSALQVGKAAKVFPWEHREHVEASRVFDSDSEI